MGQLTFSANKDGETPITYAVEIADADLDRIMAAWTTRPLRNAPPLTTPTEIVTDIAKNFSNELLRDTLASERQQFVTQAMQSVTAITATPVVIATP